MHSALLLAVSRAEEDRERLHQGLVRSLAALVPALMQDCLREATIVGAPDAGLEKIADHAGCGLALDRDPARALAAALGDARCDRVFVLRAGCVPLSGYIDELKDLDGAPRALALRLEPAGFAQRLAPRLSPVVGLSAPRRSCLEIRFSDAAEGARKLRASTLRTRAREV